ncbi:MAG: hypothetical protein IKM79_07125 [Bacteroidales bacterium]|nr:hypothetical protein [Bacteroidales bacterium]
MKNQLVHKLILLLLCMMAWQTSAVAAVETRVHEGVLIDRTDNSPHWQDVGMHDVLAVTGGSTLTPPTTVRVVHDSPAGTTPTAQAIGTRHCCIQRLSTCRNRRTISGYIYLIRCLRL